MEATNY